jgi:hypothetical protein
LFKLEEKILSGMRSEFHDLAFLFSHPLNIDLCVKWILLTEETFTLLTPSHLQVPLTVDERKKTWIL